MSKLQLEIPISKLPKKVLKELLEFCDDQTINNKINIDKPLRIKLEFLYDYNDDFSQAQSDAIVFYASKIDVDKEIERRKKHKY